MHELIAKLLICIMNLITLLWVNFLTDFFENPNDNKYLIVLFAGLLTIGVSSVIHHIKHLHDRKIFNQVFEGETNDIKRHLKANLGILRQINKKLQEEGFYPNRVHFEKMKIQEDIVLFSNDIAVKLEPNRISNLSELRKLIRNLNFELEQAILATDNQSDFLEKIIQYIIDKHDLLIRERLQKIIDDFSNNIPNEYASVNSPIEVLPVIANQRNGDQIKKIPGAQKSNYDDIDNNLQTEKNEDEDDGKEQKIE